MRGLILATGMVLTACGAATSSPRFEQLSNDPVKHGERVATVLGCTDCHGKDLTGADWSEPGFIVQHTANLSLTAAQNEPVALRTMIVSGRGTGGRELWGMPSFLFTRLTDADMDAVISFLRSAPPKGQRWPDPVMLEGARKEIAAGNFKTSSDEVREKGAQMPPDAGPENSLGAYIARATCAECHGIDLRGGIPFAGAAPRPDLRIVAAYDPEDFERLLVTGKAAGNRELGLMSAVARGRFAHLTRPERSALYAYFSAVAAKDP
jgi:mono/diheme cytochrome c family protein